MAYIGNTPPSRFVSNRAVTQFSGNGSNKIFTLEQAVAQDEDILVSVDGVIQEPSVAYVVSSGTTLTFQGSDAPSANAGNNIFVYYLASQVGTVGHPSTQGLTATTGVFSSNATVAGTLGVTGNATLAGTIAVTGTSTLTGVTALGNTGSTVKSEGGAVTTNIAQGLCKCWVNFNGNETSTDATITAQDSHNVTTIVDNGTGLYTVTIANDMANATYALTVIGDDSGARENSFGFAEAYAVGSFQIRMQNDESSSIDTDIVGCTVHGDLA
jgi:hypothetical protein